MNDINSVDTTVSTLPFIECESIVLPIMTMFLALGVDRLLKHISLHTVHIFWTSVTSSSSDLRGFFMVHDYYLEFIFQYSLHCNLCSWSILKRIK